MNAPTGQSCRARQVPDARVACSHHFSRRVFTMSSAAVGALVACCALPMTRCERQLVFDVPAGCEAGCYGCVHVPSSGCVYVGLGQQEMLCRCVDCRVDSARRREREGAK